MAIYRFRGYDFKGNWGVTVLSCDGNLSFLKRKGPTGHSWPDEDGEEAFALADDIKFEARDISLTCLLRAEDKTTFLYRVNNLKSWIEAPGLQTLYIGTTGKTHNVHLVDGGNFSMLTKWKTTGTMVGRFILKFREPLPVRAPNG